MELFSLIVQFGCRWALLSRELNGTRSEHSIKNRYNSVVKTMRKQYKITGSQKVEEKILKYLRFRANRKVKEQPGAEAEAELNISSDSKESRERSREVKLEEVDIHINSSHEAINQRGTLFDGVFEVNVHLAEAEAAEEEPVENRFLNLYISEEAAEDK